MKKTTVFLVDDHAALRDALADLVNKFDGFETIGVAGNGVEAVTMFENGTQPDIVLLDLTMPLLDGYEVSKWLAEHRPAIKMIIMTMGVKKGKLADLLSAGVYGILNKDVGRDELAHALQLVAAGEQYYCNSASKDIALYYKRREKVAEEIEKLQLTENDLNFLRLCTTGLTYKEIGQKMGLSKHAIEWLRSHLFEILGTSNRILLAMFAVKNDIVNPENPGI